MHKGSLLFLLLVYIIPICAQAIESDAISPATKGAGETKSPTQGRFTDAQRSRVMDWMRERAPGCPTDALTTAAEHFLNELSSRSPEDLDRLSTENFPLSRFESRLLQQVAASVSGPQYAALREGLAVKRINLLIAVEGTSGSSPAARADELMDKIKSASQVQHRRLLEGRMEDDDLVLLLKRTRSPAGTAAAAKSQEPKALTAADIVSEFRRHNQTGSSLQRLRAYIVDASLRTATGENQHLILTRLAPDRFRLTVKTAEATQLVLASNGAGFWQQMPQRKATELSRAEMGTKAYLAEFINPLFNDDDYTFEKLEDGAVQTIKVHRLRVLRGDGTSYVSLVDAENFHEVGREETSGAKVSYSDFREVAGITFAFRESVKDEQGRTAVLEIQRIVANPGVVQSYFEPPDQVELNYFAVEQWIMKSAGRAVAR